jgi:hypothetical protein
MKAMTTMATSSAYSTNACAGALGFWLIVNQLNGISNL